LPASRRRLAQELPPSITDPATLERAAAVLAEYIRAVVDSFPPLTPEQRDRIAALLRTPGNREATTRHDESPHHTRPVTGVREPSIDDPDDNSLTIPSASDVPAALRRCASSEECWS